MPKWIELFQRRSKSPTRKKFSCHRTEKAGNQRLMEQPSTPYRKKVPILDRFLNLKKKSGGNGLCVWTGSLRIFA